MAARAKPLRAAMILGLLSAIPATAELLDPGDPLLRHDVLLLADYGILSTPTVTWPLLSSGAEFAQYDDKSSPELPWLLDAQVRMRNRVQQSPGARIAFRTAVARHPETVRTFDDVPRAEGEIGTQFSIANSRFFVRTRATLAANPSDGDSLRMDGTVFGARIGNWLATAGWQDRWFGPGRDGSLILSTNARPPPSIGLQRISAHSFENRYLRWLGPWDLTGFLALLDDDRAVPNAWFVAIRGSFRPLRGLQIGVSRTAQWCGSGRPCDLSTFWNLLQGNDNRGVNVSSADEPGNQLGGFDIRWSLAPKMPIATYVQWIAEDGRGGGGALGSWIRMAGFENWGEIGGIGYRMHLELSDTICRQGGLGFSGKIANCAYEHSIYRTGYRYRGNSLGHGSDGASRSYSLGSTLVQSAGHVWDASIRYTELNRDLLAGANNAVSGGGEDRIDVKVSHERLLKKGKVRFGLGYQRINDAQTSATASHVTGFIEWSSE